MDAADAAKTASTDAADAVALAMTAVANLATMQTGETAGGLADEAQTAADKAMMAYMHAKTFSEAAAEAEVLTAAVEARVMAETAMANAVKYGKTATEKAGEAETAAMAELMIDDTVKSVGGDTTIDAAAPASTVVSGTGANEKTEITGLVDDLELTTMGPATTGRNAMAPDADGTPPTRYMSPAANAVERTLTIGKTVDSADDTARLRIVTKYADTQTVKVISEDSSDGAEVVTTTVAGKINVDNGPDEAADTADDVFSDLRSVGMYHVAVAGTVLSPASLGDTVAANATPKEVFRYVSAAGTDQVFGTADDVLSYVTLRSTLVAGAVTLYTYNPATISIDFDTDGDATTDPVPVGVTAKIPVAKPYNHIHFGVWGSLGAATPSGAQTPADLGIGFLQNIGDGLTAVMPNNGTGEYAGNWVGSVKNSHATGDGNIRQESNKATMTANFRKGEIEGILTDLVDFEADITGSSFSTDKVDVTSSNLDADAKWTGDLSGGFYGDDAIESGGVFSFTTKDDEGGAFTGAFGTVRTDE